MNFGMISNRFRDINVSICYLKKVDQFSRSTIFAITLFDGRYNRKAQHGSWHTAKCTIALEMKYKRLRYSRALQK